MDKETYTLADWIYGIGMALWFIGSIVVMAMMGEQYPAVVAIGIGQMLMVLGIMITVDRIKKGEFDPLILWAVIIGLGSFSIGIMIQFGNEYLKRKAEGYTLYLFFGAFFLFGVLGIWEIDALRKKKKKCTVPVIATCINLTEDELPVRIGTVKEYVWEYQFEYNGKVYKVPMTKFDFCDVTEGASYNIYINPKNPKRFSEIGPWEIKRIGAYIPALFLCVVFVVVGIGGMIYCGLNSEEITSLFMEMRAN